MKPKKKAQFSIIETLVVVMLFISITSYFYHNYSHSNNNYQLQTESLIDAIYYSNNARNLIFNEDLTISTTLDWSSITNLIDKDIKNYEIQISNDQYIKTIKSCNATSGKLYSERILFTNTSHTDFRKLRLGVCY